MGKLNVELQRCFFMIFNPQNLGVTWWMASGESVDLGNGYFVPYSEHPPQLAYLKGWQERKETWRYVMQGEEKALWDNFLFSQTELVTLPHFIIENMKSFKTIHLDGSFNSFGCLTTGNEQPLTNESFDLLIRFSKVFDLTYTRFNDIKIAEAQTDQAKQDLIQIQTEKKRAEEALFTLQSTQTQLIQAEKMASLGELTAGIAHEIQNPLNFVNNFSELNNELVAEIDEQLAIGNEQYAKGNPQQAITHLQQAKDLITDIKANSEKINHHGKRAESIVKSMLEHSRKSSGIKEPTDINKLCDEYVRLSYHACLSGRQGLRAKDSKFNCDYKLDLDPNLPLVNVVSQDIGRVILNILNNAFQACTENLVGSSDTQAPANQQGFKPLVMVTTKYFASSRLPTGQAGLCSITISDNGPGIPESIRDKIFQPFFTTKPTGQGTGLGLSLAYDIVKAHGGMIQVNTNYHPLVATPNETNKVYQPETSTEFIISLKVDGQDQLS
ncbi:MAG: hypothetical protein IPP04_00755 [Saprospiraceae bacterium]|nr:hypothetical protein [Saprospiraceae bacterium]